MELKVGKIKKTSVMLAIGLKGACKRNAADAAKTSPGRAAADDGETVVALIQE